MRFSAALLGLLISLSGLTGCGPAQPPAPPLTWAYPTALNSALPPPPPGLQHVPESALALTLAQVSDEQNPPDWFPNEHPPAPDIVARGHPGGSTPCAECHLMNGQGFLGAANLTGLSADYIVEQVREYRSGRRVSAQPHRADTEEMIKVAKMVSDADLAAAAAYFTILPKRPWMHVIETDTVPVTRPDRYGWLDLVPGGGVEPIKGRVIEVPEDARRLYLEDPHLNYIDYVPVGAVARGAALVHSGGPDGQPCTSCHGADLRGLGKTPALAGRSAAYLARMLWDIKIGARGGPAVAQMQQPARTLDEAQITDIVAYLASLKP